MEYPIVSYRTHYGSGAKIVFFNVRSPEEPMLLDLDKWHKKFVAFVDGSLFKNQEYLNME